MTELGAIKVGGDGWPIQYCEDRHGNRGWVGMILPPWDRNGTYDFVSAEDRPTAYPAAEMAELTDTIHTAIHTAIETAIEQIAEIAKPVGREVIETVHGLAALPEMVAIVDAGGGVARKYNGDWHWVGMEVTFSPALPVTVLWNPEVQS